MTRSGLLLLPLCLVFAACTHHVDVALRPEYQTALAPAAELATVTPPLAFVQGDFTDRRPDTTRLATFKQGMHTYNLFGERPIQDALFEGLHTLFTSAEQRWDEPGADPSDVRVNLELMNVQADRNAGVINVGATSSIQVKLDFLDAQDGQLIYSEVYNGTDKRTRALIGLMGMVRQSIDASIVNCLNAVGADAKLAAALRRLRGGS